jgi:hypothetical protein
MAYEAVVAALSDPARRVVFERLLNAPRRVTDPLHGRRARHQGRADPFARKKLGDAATSLRERYERGSGTVFEHHFVESANSSAT